jgi:uncharacterized MAPEG superfamily protein
MTVLGPEVFALVVTSLFTGLLWIPYLVNRIVEDGPWPVLSAPNLRPSAPWAERLMRAHTNAVENLAVFAPLALAVVVTHRTTNLTGTASLVYFAARVAHAALYAAGIPVFRTLVFATGFACQMILVLALLGAR